MNRGKLSTGKLGLGLPTVLMAIMAIGTVQPYAVAVLAADLIDALGISRFQIGLLAMANAIAGGIVSRPMGAVADAIGGKRLGLILFALGALGMFLIGGATGFGMAALGAAISGTASGSSNPAANKLITHLVEPGKRGVITGLKQSGVQVGNSMSGAFLPAIASVWSWRTACIVVALIALGLAVVTVFAIETDPGDGRRPKAVSRERLPVDVRWLALYGFLMGAGVGAAGTFLPLFSQESLGFDGRTAGLVAAAAAATAVVARIVFGRLTQGARHFAPAHGILAAVGVVTALCIAAAEPFGSWLVWVGAVGLGVSFMAWNSITNLAAMEIVDKAEAGRATGLAQAGFLLGLGVSPPIFGWFVDGGGSYPAAYVAVGGLALLAAISTVGWYRSTPVAAP